MIDPDYTAIQALEIAVEEYHKGLALAVKVKKKYIKEGLNLIKTAKERLDLFSDSELEAALKKLPDLCLHYQRLIDFPI